MIVPDFSGATVYQAPFPHVRVPELLSQATAEALLDWFDTSAPWVLRVAEFYEQHEFSLLHCSLPAEVAYLVSERFITGVSRGLCQSLGARQLELTDVAVHRLLEGQTIRIHNDHIGREETHRLVVQLNRGWTVEQGGLFLIFKRDDPESVADIMLPVHRSAFGFEISKRSHHAVSTIHNGKRDSVVFTFRAVD